MAVKYLSVFIIAMLSVFPSGKSVRIKIIPDYVVEESQQDVEVTCVSDKQGSVSIRLQKDGGINIANVGRQEDLPYGLAGESEQLKSTDPVGTRNWKTSMTVTISNPRNEDQGEYTCNLYYTDKYGNVSTESESANLTVVKRESTETDINKIVFTLDRIGNFGEKTKILSDKDNQQARISWLEEKVVMQADLIKGLDDKVTKNTEFISLLKKRRRKTWTMVFRATAGNGFKVLDAWNNVGHSDNLTAYTTQELLSACPTGEERSACNTHLRSHLLDEWDNVRKVKVALYTKGKEVFQVTFTGDETHNRNEFFKSGRVIDSSVPELVNYRGKQNFFTIDGLDLCERRFYINKSWGGCPHDRGWLLINDAYRTYRCCKFDSTGPHPVFYYTKANRDVKLSNENLVGKAQVLAVWVQFSQ